MSHEKPGAAAFPSVPGLCRRSASMSAANLRARTPRRLSARAADTDVRLSAIPPVFVDNDGVETLATESLSSFLVVEDEGSTPIEPLEARIRFVSGRARSGRGAFCAGLAGVRDVRFKTKHNCLSETFDLRHHFSVPVSLNVDLAALSPHAHPRR